MAYPTQMTRYSLSLIFAWALAIAGPLATGHALAAPPACVVPGHWQVPGGPVIPRQAALAQAQRATVVLLGEQHTDADHHQWQLETLAALHGANRSLVLALEMFPRELQPVLEDWIAGRLDEPTFLERTDWKRTWGTDPELYMPIFRYARDHAVPMRAVNIPRTVSRAVAREGWQALPAELAAELGTPAAPTEGYLADLRETFAAHAAHVPNHDPSDDAFRRFVDAQLLWDRAMAAGIQQAATNTQVVALMGSGHIRHGFGVPHQLRDLAIEGVFTLIPWSREDDCDELRSGYADIVVGTGQRGPSPHPPSGLQPGQLRAGPLPGSASSAAARG